MPAGPDPGQGEWPRTPQVHTISTVCYDGFRGIAPWIAMVTLALRLSPEIVARTDPHLDPKAVEIAERIHRILGGGALEHAGYLGFVFSVTEGGAERSTYRHDWNRHRGTYRLEGNTGEGHAVVLFDPGTRQGQAWLDGRKVPAADAGPLLEFAYGRFINDTYWLLVPFKLRDPGVHLAYGGERVEGARSFDLLDLSFEGVGLTPGDRYTLWVDRATHRVDRWEMVLEGRQPPPIRSDWYDWINVGGVWFSTRKTLGARAIVLRDIEVGEVAPAGRFEPPGPPRP